MVSFSFPGIFIAHERQRKEVLPLLSSREMSAENGGISAVTASELLHGVHRAQNAAIRGRRSAFVEGILCNLPIYPFDAAAARAHARLWAGLSSRGVNVDAHDLLIAATAMSLGFGVITLNRKDFMRVPGLKVVSP